MESINPNDFPNYDSLPVIQSQNIISSLQTIVKSFSNDSVPDKIVAINTLRCLHKNFHLFFIDSIGGLKNVFINNCLNCTTSIKLQQISLLFITELLKDDFDDDTENFIYWFYDAVFNLIKNNNLKNFVENAIKTMSKEMPYNATIVVLIQSLKYDDEYINKFIFDCLRIVFISFKGKIHFCFDFNEIFRKLKIKELYETKGLNDKYFNCIKMVFQIMKSFLEKDEEEELMSKFSSKNKMMYDVLTQN